MTKDQNENMINKSQGNMAPSCLSYYSSPTTASSGYPNTPEEQDLISHLIQTKEAFKEEMNKCKEVQENTIKQVKEINTTVQDLKVGMCLCSCIKCGEIFYRKIFINF